MPLETATYISDLNTANPAHSDQLNAADAHMRLIKSTLQATFPSITGAVTATHTQINTIAGLSHPWVTADYTDLSVTTGKLADNAVTAAKLADDAVDTAAIVDLNVTTAKLAASAVTTAKITDANVTYAKIQNVAATALLGNPTGSSAAASEITLGAGLQFSGTTIVAPATPIRGLSKNKRVQVATNTTITIACDGVIVSDGTDYFNVSVNNTLSTNAGIGLDQLDSATTIAAATWLYVYAIYNGTTVKTVASTSSTSPDLTNGAFSGYTYWAYLGAVRTAAASTNLMGTVQTNDRTQYVLGLAQTSSVQTIAALTSATLVAESVSTLVPPTAYSVVMSGVSNNAAANLFAAPNSSYVSSSSPMYAIGGAVAYEMVLESTDVYCASNGAATATFYCHGWRDKQA